MRKISVLSLTVISMLILSSCSENYSNGERIGLVTKFSRSGLWFKSWEGELHVTQTGMNSTMNDFNFSVDNNKETDRVNVISALDSAAKLGWKVRIIYHECKGENITGSRGDTEFFVDSVQVLDKSIIGNAFNNRGDSVNHSGHVIDTIYVVIVPKEKISR